MNTSDNAQFLNFDKVSSRSGRLILISGLSCSGKTYLMKSLRNDANFMLIDMLNMGSTSAWEYRGVSSIGNEPSVSNRRLVVQYSFPLPWHHPHFRSQSEKKKLSHIFDQYNSHNTSIITVWAGPRTIRRRIPKRCFQLIYRFLGMKVAPKKCFSLFMDLLRLERLTRYPDILSASYDTWFMNCEADGRTDHLIINTSRDTFHILPFSKWRMLTSCA